MKYYILSNLFFSKNLYLQKLTTLPDDENAFIFSLINGENRLIKVNVAKGEEKFAIGKSKMGLLIFGRGDICISDNPNISNNTAFFGHSYVHKDYPKDSEKVYCFLTGTKFFKVEEIKVFTVSKKAKKVIDNPKKGVFCSTFFSKKC